MEFFKKKPNPLLVEMEDLKRRVHVLEVQLSTYKFAAENQPDLVEPSVPVVVPEKYDFEFDPLTGTEIVKEEKQVTGRFRPYQVTDKMLKERGYKHLVNLRSIYCRLVSIANTGEIYSYKERQYVRINYSEDDFAAFVQNTAEYHQGLKSVYACHAPVVPTLKPCDTFLLLFLLNFIAGEIEDKKQYVQNAYELIGNYFSVPTRTPPCGGWVIFFIAHCAYYKIDVSKAIPVLLNETSKKTIENFAVKISTQLKNSEQTEFEGF